MFVGGIREQINDAVVEKPNVTLQNSRDLGVDTEVFMFVLISYTKTEYMGEKGIGKTVHAKIVSSLRYFYFAF